MKIGERIVERIEAPEKTVWRLKELRPCRVVATVFGVEILGNWPILSAREVSHLAVVLSQAVSVSDRMEREARLARVDG